MVYESPVVLTADGMQRLHHDLRNLRERHASLVAWVTALPPDDARGDVQTEIALVDQRIAELRAVLARAMPLDQTTRVPGVVGIGSRVTVRWEEDGEETYTIVETAEAAPGAGRISDESPVGQALVGRRAGDRVAVATLGGPAWLELLAVD